MFNSRTIIYTDTPWCDVRECASQGREIKKSAEFEGYHLSSVICEYCIQDAIEMMNKGT